MGFKLGTERGNYAVNGEIRTKLKIKIDEKSTVTRSKKMWDLW